MTGLPWIAMLLVAGAFLAMFAVGEAIHRHWDVAPEVTRRLDHVVAGGIALILPVLFDSPWPVLVLAMGFLALLAVTSLAGRLGSVHGISRSSAGAYVYPVALVATFAIAHDDVGRYSIAVLALALSDAMGGYVGVRSGRRRYAAWGQVKSLEGSVAALVTTTIVTSAILMVAGLPPADACLTGLFTGLVVALIEGALPWGLDNLGIPLATLVALEAAASPATAGSLLIGAALLLGAALALPGRRARTARTPTALRVAAPDAERT